VSAVRAKTPARSLVPSPLGSSPEGRTTASGDIEAPHVGVERIIDRASEPRLREAILSVGSSTSDEFHIRLAAWLADVAMNGQGTM
jgi:hypothetical protein